MTTPSIAPIPRGATILFAIGLLFSTSGLLLAPPASAAEKTDSEIFRERIEEMQAVFDAEPELKSRKGSGWKPFNRVKWFHEQRMVDGELPPVDGRWNAWLAKKEIERESVPRARNSWFSLGPTNFSGRMLAIDFHPSDPNIVYVGAASGGVWKSTDNGINWTPIADDIPVIAVGGLAVDKTDPDVVVIGTGEATLNVDAVSGVGMLRSTDAGNTWIPTSLTTPLGGGGGCHFVECSVNGTFLAGRNDGLWRSTDGGATWDTVRVGGDYYDAVWKPGDPTRVYTVKGNDGSGNNVKVSTDDGQTWAKAGTGQPFSFQIGKSKLGVTAANPVRLFALFGELGDGGGTTGFYRSTDDGATWTERNGGSNLIGGQSWYNMVCTGDPDDPGMVIIGGVTLAKSDNTGGFFYGIGGNVHVDMHDIAYEPGSSSIVWVASDGGLWRSTNDGDTWSNRDTGIVTYQFYDICVNNDDTTAYYVMGGTQDNGTDKWSGTTTWGQGLGGDGMVCNISRTNGNTVYAEMQFGNHHRNTNAGVGIWSPINGGITGEGLWVTPVDADPSDGSRLFTSTSHGVFRSTSGGSGWVNVAGHPAGWISISPVDGDVVWSVAGASSPWYSTDGGDNWTQTSNYGFLTGGTTKVLAHPTDINTALVTFSGYAGYAHVALTTDMGGNWTDVTGDLPDHATNAVAIDPSDPDYWYIGTDLGVWYSTNGGTNWTPFQTGLPNVVIHDLEIQNTLRKLVAGSHGRGAWEINIPPGASDAELDVNPVSLRMMLDAPFPNPVSDRTMLRYAAKHDGTVTLDVYDVQGRHVINLAEFTTGDGIIRTTPWFPDDVPSGVYFAVLKAGEEQMTRKMVVTK
jgi:hypothetical protein